MNMDLRDTIKRILFLPFEFSQADNGKSIYSLLQETGYFDDYDKITEKPILQELINHLNCIEYWFVWS